jgi:hypothetical protein
MCALCVGGLLELAATAVTHPCSGPSGPTSQHKGAAVPTTRGRQPAGHVLPHFCRQQPCFFREMCVGAAWVCPCVCAGACRGWAGALCAFGASFGAVTTLRPLGPLPRSPDPRHAAPTTVFPYVPPVYLVVSLVSWGLSPCGAVGLRSAHRVCWGGRRGRVRSRRYDFCSQPGWPRGPPPPAGCSAPPPPTQAPAAPLPLIAHGVTHEGACASWCSVPSPALACSPPHPPPFSSTWRHGSQRSHVPHQHRRARARAQTQECSERHQHCAEGAGN